MQELQQKLKNNSETLQVLAEQVARNTETSTTNAQGIERLTTVINDELKKQQQLLENRRADPAAAGSVGRQQVILDAIAQKDSAGRDILRLSANMEQSEEFREDVRKAVHQALDTHGELTIWNRMETGSRCS